MPNNNPITTPAGYAPAFAIGFSDQSGTLSIVQSDRPLPVSLLTDAPGAPLEGQASADVLGRSHGRRHGRHRMPGAAGGGDRCAAGREADGGVTT